MFAKYEGLIAEYADENYCADKVSFRVKTQKPDNTIDKAKLQTLFGAIRAGLQFDCPAAESVEMQIYNESSQVAKTFGSVSTGHLEVFFSPGNEEPKQQSMLASVLKHTKLDYLGEVLVEHEEILISTRNIPNACNGLAKLEIHVARPDMLRHKAELQPKHRSAIDAVLEKLTKVCPSASSKINNGDWNLYFVGLFEGRPFYTAYNNSHAFKGYNKPVEIRHGYYQTRQIANPLNNVISHGTIPKKTKSEKVVFDSSDRSNS